ncbi:MAG: hypothetical protein B7Z06_02250 [Flavobacteriales bacterium 32-35-8]|nr:MAG: hypothetical protein B7Z06_02250 [Flavobacteriales bacterium 32-35-8]
MKERLEIRKISSFLPILGLAVLLLLSPCKVRNYIQAELGLPQTQVSNKSQSIISQSNCQTFEVSDAVQTIAKPTLQQSYFLISDTYRLVFTPDLFKQSIHPITSRNHKVSLVPLYILYQNLKVYS